MSGFLQDNRLSNEDLLAFLRSISFQSKTLGALFCSPASAQDWEFEVASADDMAELHALAAGLTAQLPLAPVVEQHAPVQKRGLDSPLFSSNKRTKAVEAPSAPVSMPAIAIEDEVPHTTSKQAKRTRRPKISEPTDDESRLMREWSSRRVTEIMRRQTESCGAQSKTVYLAFVVNELRRRLPSSELPSLLDNIRQFNSGASSPEEFGDYVNGMVEKHAIVVPLSFKEEVNVRPKPVKRGVRLSVGSDEIAIEDDESEVPRHSCSGNGHTHPKELCTGGIKEALEQQDDEDACCPVCKSSPVEDERWVKCDGCSTWYHQICVLFNELAHGKSVRFFCRTPGCRKRGSRQLNRRQRKPCYPMSEGLEATPLAQTVSAACLAVSRQDRAVVARVVASEASQRGGEKRRGKTLMVFQHTMTGSDLLFLTAFIEEKGGRLTITNCDSNGLYEESYPGERLAVEAAVVEGIIQHARKAGCETVGMTNPAAIEDSTLFYCRPSKGAWVAGDADATYERAMLAAKAAGALVGSVQRDGNVIFAKLKASGDEVVLDDADTPCKMAEQRESLLGMMTVNDYRFDSLQSAKFSSMMIVYHLAKGWRKDWQVSFASAYRRGASAVDEDEDEDEDIESANDDDVPAQQANSDMPAQSTADNSMPLTKTSSFELSRTTSMCSGNLFDWSAGVNTKFASISRNMSFDMSGRNDGGESYDMAEERPGEWGLIEQRFQQLITKQDNFMLVRSSSSTEGQNQSLPTFDSDNNFWDSFMQN